MDQRLKQVAEAGDINGLYELIVQDSFVLDNIDRVPFIDTPLHIAARKGNTAFAMEVVNLKPSFARKLNQDGYRPVHLALGGGHELIVKGLVEMDNVLVRLKGREGRTPLHEATILGNTDLLEKFLSACPMAFEDLTVKRETALHLAVKCNQLGAFKFLMEWLKLHNRKEVLRHKDDEGNTILHLGVACTDHDEVVKMLLGKQYVEWVEVNAKNSQDLTALDVVKTAGESHNRQTQEALSRAGSRNIKQITWNILPDSLRYFRYHEERDKPGDVRNALLVVAVLIATATYEVGLKKLEDHDHSSNNQGVHLEDQEDSSYTENPMLSFMFTLCNSLGFYSSVFMMVILTMGFPLQRVLLVSLSAMFFTFLYSLLANSEDPGTQYANSEYPGTQYANSEYPGTQYANSEDPGTQYTLYIAMVGICGLILACGYIAIRFLSLPKKIVEGCGKSSTEGDNNRGNTNASESA